MWPSVWQRERWQGLWQAGLIRGAYTPEGVTLREGQRCSHGMSSHELKLSQKDPDGSSPTPWPTVSLCRLSLPCDPHSDADAM